MSDNEPQAASEFDDGASRAGEPRWRRFEPPLMPQGPALGEFVERAFPGARATALAFLDRGLLNSNYRITLAGPSDGSAWSGPTVVRLRLSRSEEGPLREGALGELLATRLAGLAPRLLATERGEAPEPHRRSFFSWIEGEPIDELRPGMAPDGGTDSDSCVLDLARAIFRLHAVAPPAFGRLDRAGHPQGREQDAGRDARRRAEARFVNPAHGLPPERLQPLREAFARLSAPLCGSNGPRPALVHGDLAPEHVLVRTDPQTGAARLSGLIDWERARAADPAGDFAALRLDWTGRLSAMARAVERAYLALAAAEGPAGGLVEWERRVAVALVPRLLDARMVARRRLAGAELQEIDRRLDLALGDGAAGA